MPTKRDRDTNSAFTPLHQMEDRTLARTSNYNETVRANNNRYDRGDAGKTLPKGRVAGAQWKKSRGKSRS